jgi:hypothetical protein
MLASAKLLPRFMIRNRLQTEWFDEREFMTGWFFILVVFVCVFHAFWSQQEWLFSSSTFCLEVT